jgi:hypothetical protein
MCKVFDSIGSRDGCLLLTLPCELLLLLLLLLLFVVETVRTVKNVLDHWRIESIVLWIWRNP